MPTLRSARTAASGRVSGSRASAPVSACTPRSSGAPRCGVPRVIVSRTNAVHGRADPVPLPAWCSALRATSPPIECPISTRSLTGTGHASTSRPSRASSERPFAEMRSPVL